MNLISDEVRKRVLALEDETKLRVVAILERDIIVNAVNYIKNLMANYDSSHDHYHVIRVLDLAILIYINDYVYDKSVDLNIIVLSALFHDAADFKYDNAEGADLKEVAIGKLKDFFIQNHIPLDTIFEKVLYIITNISFRKEIEGKKINVSKELMIVRDADRLDAIGAIGIARCFGYSAVKRQPFYIKDLPIINNMTAEKYNDQTSGNKTTSYNHFFEKLLTLKDRMMTDTGKRISVKRHEFMLDFLKQFKSEMEHINN